MTNTTIVELDETIRYWWIVLLTGLIPVAIGIWVFAAPAKAYMTLSILFGVSIIIIGIFEAMFAISVSKCQGDWIWTLAGGLLDILIGIYMVFYPATTMAILPFVLGFWLMLRGFSAIAFSFDMKYNGDINWGLLLILAMGIIFLAVIILMFPAFGVVNIVTCTGLAFIFAGVFRIVFAFRLKNWKRVMS